MSVALAFTLATANRAEDLSWMDMAACDGVDPEIFFPGRGASHAMAKMYCKSCPVRFGCLDYAVRNNIADGVWGGASVRERRRIRARRAAAA